MLSLNQANMYRKTILILDRNKRVIAVLLGKPRDTSDPGQVSWHQVHDEGVRCLKEAAVDMSLTGTTDPHRRGTHHTVAHGISYGGGQDVRIFLKHGSSLSELDM